MRILLLALLGITLPASLKASIVYSGVQDIDITTSFAGVYFDFTDGNNAATFPPNQSSEGTGWDFNPFFGGYALASNTSLQPVTAAATATSNVLNLTTTDIVDGTDTFPTSSSGETGSASHFGGSPNQFTSGTEGYIGFRIDSATFLTNASTGYYYGWMRVTLKDDGDVGTFHDWAWDNTGAAITVGAIPEVGTALPAALILLSVVTFHRRRRR